jgi:tRNA pseudouridine38-40 synthase
VRCWAFLLAYDGGRYFGFVRQPGRRTVEGEILKALRACGLHQSIREARYRVASRTDRGVSAIGQVISIELDAEPDIAEINSKLPADIAFLAAEEVDPGFDARKMAREKHYRYVCEIPTDFDIGLAKQAAGMFFGEHDFFNFCKREPGVPTTGELDVLIDVGKALRFDFVGRKFLWQQVRRIVGAILLAGQGKLSLEEIGAMLGREVDKSLQPAPAEGLFLVSVKCEGVKFELDAGAVERFDKYLHGKESLVHGAMAESLSRGAVQSPQ